MKIETLDNKNLIIIPETDFEKSFLSRFKDSIGYIKTNDCNDIIGLKIENKTFEQVESNNGYHIFSGNASELFHKSMEGTFPKGIFPIRDIGVSVIK